MGGSQPRGWAHEAIIGMRTDPKKIGDSDIIGEGGIAFIHSVVSAMGCLWYPTGGVEAGIDGEIEIRDPVTKQMSGCVLRVQSKATTKPFPGETDNGFEWPCDIRDIDYWLQANVPVLLIVSRPASNEGYWIHTQDFFRDPQARRTRKAAFDKRLHRFDSNCRPALAELAVPKQSGLFIRDAPRKERLFSNLLALDSHPGRLYIAETDFRDRGQLWRELKRLDPSVSSTWLLTSGQLIAFHNLCEYPWSRVCDVGTVESFGSAEWSLSQDAERQRQFVQLLQRALQDKLYEIFVRYDRDRKYYFFTKKPNSDGRRISYYSKRKQTSREVVKRYSSSTAPDQAKYFRHAAFKGHFKRIEGRWYLEITPTYHFTSDGKEPCRYGEDLVKGIKRVEGNAAVLGQVVMWARILSERPNLFSESDAPLLTFGSLLTFEVEGGVDDEAWSRREEPGRSVLTSDDDLGILDL